MTGQIILRQGGRELRFAAPARVAVAWRPEQVVPALEAIESAVLRQGHYAAGFISYEAAAAFGLAVHPPLEGLPLLWFGLYERPDTVERSAAPEPPSAGYSVGSWRPAIDRDAYAAAVSRVKDYLARGHSYQVNYTFPLRATFSGEPEALFAELAAARQGDAAFIDLGRFAICSASPELFFRLDGESLLAKPMKGTAKRGLTLAQDEAQRAALARSPKNRAENLMIVDMLRNDLGRVARIGSVAVPHLFEVERYPTLLQMTSTVTARTRASVVEILASLFPCASITGAPKARTTHIIRELEPQPRGVYTGAIGFIGPDRQARFNVAIRTALIDRERETAIYGVGGGLVWDSKPAEEYDECLLKARVLIPQPPFELLETLLWEPETGYFLLEAHLARLADTAVYFGAPLDRTAIENRLRTSATGLRGPHKIRLLVQLNGVFTVEITPLAASAPPPLRVALAAAPVDSRTPWLYHKTTRRAVYEAARASRPDCDDALLWNERGELTEASLANIALDLGGRWYTPPVASGLLAGVFRSHLLASGRLRERVLTRADLRAARGIALLNSVRKWQPAAWVA
ncbi:MAG: aminodeoxychorismate synthase component I [Candidatus Competibacter sp.]|nr:aminodeoxychorismate synthase component I [Candidatus Competibacter sp.]